MSSHLLRLIPAALLAVSSVGASTAAAQTLRQPGPAGGWTFTPGLVATTGWDNNALILGEGRETPDDFVNVINPRAEAVFKGRRGEFAGSYDGAFRLYRSLDGLNSFDQQATVSGRRLLSRHLTVFASNRVAAAPTTESTELAGIPFVRSGTKSEYFRGGVESALTRRTSLSGAYTFQVVRFDDSELLSTRLRGGHSHGAALGLRREFTSRTAFVADYNLQHAAFSDAGQFSIHRTEGGIEHRPDENVRFFAAIGVSRLTLDEPGGGRTGPSWRASLARTFESGTADVSYSRSFVPSYAFGGTQENEELSGSVQLTLSRALYTRSSLTWRLNEPLIPDQPKLRTLSLFTSLGYAAAPWMGIEGFFNAYSQSIDRSGGLADRLRLGVQVVTSKPMRIR
jgi:hypothetical protein